jgi:hypothetical protein
MLLKEHCFKFLLHKQEQKKALQDSSSVSRSPCEKKEYHKANEQIDSKMQKSSYR